MYKLFLLISVFISLNIFGQTGIITRVIDGDTFVFQTDSGTIKVRMQGIDAPEKKQEYGIDSKKFIEKYTNKPAKIKFYGLDKYKRTLATLYVNGIDINLESLKNGYSWHYKKYSKDLNYAKAELTAKNKKLGLWRNPQSTAPWEFRHLKK